MPYKIQIESSFSRDMKSFKKNARLKQEIGEHLESILADPGAGKRLSSNMEGLFNYGFGSKPQYRIIYRLYNCCDMGVADCPPFQEGDGDTEEGCKGLIQFLFIKTREECNNLYNFKKKYFELSEKEGYDIDLG